jgi:hypothetical protein
MNNEDLDEEGLPIREGEYLIKGIEAFSLGTTDKIEVYEFPPKGLCCYCYDFGSSGTEGVNDDTDCHVSIYSTGLEFISRIGDIK